MTWSIGEFNRVNYQQILKKYAYNRMLLCLLGGNKCNYLRRGFLNDNNAVMKERDYDEALKAWFGI